MFWHMILGFLREGDSRHGYELMTEYAARSGNKVSAGNFYRELARLVTDGFVETGVNPPNADARRIPYRIQESGRQAFDRWLSAPSKDDADLAFWLIFADRASADTRARVLDLREEDLWIRSKALARLRDAALASTPRADSRYYPLPTLLSRQLKQVTAELEFLREFRTDFEAWLRTSERASGRESQVDSDRPAVRRRKGGPKR